MIGCTHRIYRYTVYFFAEILILMCPICQVVHHWCKVHCLLPAAWGQASACILVYY